MTMTNLMRCTSNVSCITLQELALKFRDCGSRRILRLKLLLWLRVGFLGEEDVCEGTAIMASCGLGLVFW